MSLRQENQALKLQLKVLQAKESEVAHLKDAIEHLKEDKLNLTKKVSKLKSDFDQQLSGNLDLK